MGALSFMPKWAWILLGAVALLAAFYFTLDAYGDARYDAGKEKTDQEWKAASDRLVAKAAQAEGKANKTEAKRLAVNAEKIEAEKEKIDAAVEEGSSPLDVIFNTVSG